MKPYGKKRGFCECWLCGSSGTRHQERQRCRREGKQEIEAQLHDDLSPVGASGCNPGCARFNSEGRLMPLSDNG